MRSKSSASNMNVGSNVEAIVRQTTRDIHRRTAEARKSGLASLTAQREIGASLITAKEAMSGVHGWFGRWAKEEFGFSKQWRTRLMKLDAEWERFGVAREWAETEKISTGGKEFSVDGALALIERWRRATDPEYASTKSGSHRTSTSSASSGETEVERLRRLLAVEELRNRTLKRQIDELKTTATNSAEIDPETKTKAIKVAELWVRGGTDGERQAAKERLRDLADRFDVGFPTFLRVCGIDPAPDYTFAQAA